MSASGTEILTTQRTFLKTEGRKGNNKNYLNTAFFIKITIVLFVSNILLEKVRHKYLLLQTPDYN